MSKIIISSCGDSLDSSMDKRFGRAAWFCAYDDVSKDIVFFRNECEGLDIDAGISISKMLIGMKADIVISGDFGLKVQKLFNKASIQMVIPDNTEQSIRQIIEIITK